MQNYSDILTRVQTERIQQQNNFEDRLAQISQLNKNKTVSKKVEVRQFICVKCGQLTERCSCKPAPKEAHLLYGAERLEYKRDHMLHKQADKRDLPNDAEIVRPELVKSKMPDSEIKAVEPKLAGLSEAAVRQRNAASAKKWEAVANVQAEMTAAASLTPVKLDDKIAKATVKSAKDIGFETAASALDAGNMTREYVSDLMDELDIDDMVLYFYKDHKPLIL